MNNSTFARSNGLGSGDVLFGPKSNIGIVQHFIVYVGTDSMGNDLYMDNNVKEGVRYMYESQMLQENPYQTLQIRRLQTDYNGRQQAMLRAQSLHGKSYHVTEFNCEHFANYVQYNVPYSEQVQKSEKGFLMAASLIGLIALVGGILGR